MGLESFYGGKPGISPVIRNSFKFVNTGDPAYIAKIGSNTPYSELSPKEIALLEIVDPNLNITSEGSIKWDENYLKPFTMDECFADPNYRDVWYSELCIIDTDNKMNPNNGKIFRRTLKRTETAIDAGDTRYAEYIGQIVGPSGGVPNIFFGSIDSAREKAAGLAKTLETDGEITKTNPLDVSGWDYSYPTIKKDNNDNDIIEISTANITTFTPGNRSDDDQHIAILSSIHDNILNDNQYGDNIELVPGKDQNGNFNDDIQYTWCNVRRTLTNGGQEDAWIYLGFKIPYTVFDVDVQKENYRYDGDYLIDNSTTPESNTYHPFSKQYTFHIPRGTRGIGPEEIFIVTPENKNNTLGSETTLYDFDAIEYNQETDTYSISTDPNKIKTLNPNKEKTYWVAKWTLYNPEKKSEPVIYQYLGSYRDISEIDLGNNGTITINYSDGTNRVFNKKLNWITDVTVNTDIQSENYGKFTITFNNENISNGAYNTILPLIKSTSYDPDITGNITFNYAGNGKDVTITTPLNIKDIKNIKISDGENPTPVHNASTNGWDETENQTPIYGHLYVQYRREDYYTDLGPVNLSPTVGIVLQDILSNEEDTVENWLNDLNNGTNKQISNSDLGNSSAIIYSDGRIEINEIDKTTDRTGGFIAVTKNIDDNPITYIVYYDSYNKKWINGGALNGEINSKYATGVYVQTNSETVTPSNNQKAAFTFILAENSENNKNSPLIMPWQIENYGYSNSSNNQEESNSEDSGSSNSG